MAILDFSRFRITTLKSNIAIFHNQMYSKSFFKISKKPDYISWSYIPASGVKKIQINIFSFDCARAKNPSKANDVF